MPGVCTTIFMNTSVLLGVVLALVYVGALAYLFCYSLMQLDLLLVYSKFRASKSTGQSAPIMRNENQPNNWPGLTIQLPLYNEPGLVRRLLSAIDALDYPDERCTVQILDDSTDETTALVRDWLRQEKLSGKRYQHLRRPDRQGFKAGALQFGLERSQHPLVAVFDADFCPREDFLKQAVHMLWEDDQLGMVQARWEHQNQSKNVLTQVQAFALNGHFSTEQGGRHSGGMFMNFNGTAGVWRKQCIEEAGGWKDLSLTEDLELSYRAQFEGWAFRFLEHLSVPADLPENMQAYKSQQFRWTKGAAETARLHVPHLFKKSLGFRKQFHALHHLLNGLNFILILLSVLLTIPLMFLYEAHPAIPYILHVAILFMGGLGILFLFYWPAFRYSGEPSKTYPKHFLTFLLFSTGMAVNNARAALLGFLGKRSPFVRTPKFAKGSEQYTLNIGQLLSEPSLVWELLLVFYCLAGALLSIHLEIYFFLFYHLLVGSGTLMVALLSIKDLMASLRLAKKKASVPLSA